MRRAATLVILASILAMPGCVTSPPPEEGERDESLAESPRTLRGALIETAFGDITMVFYPRDAPLTTANIARLIDSGYYDGRAFGRVVPGHVIQVTDAGGLGATEDLARVPLEVNKRLHFSAGAVGIARGEDPDSNGPEFFIMDYATSHLDGNYTVFAQVVDGLDVVHAIARSPALELPRVPGDPGILPDRYAHDPVTMTRVTMIDVTLAAVDAARLPMEIGENTRDATHRFSMDWPADLSVGETSTLTWYVRPYGDAPELNPADLTMRVGVGDTFETPSLAAHREYPGILSWPWTPPGVGDFTAVLLESGEPRGEIVIRVRA